MTKLTLDGETVIDADEFCKELVKILNGAGTYNPFPLQNIGGELYSVYPADVATKKFVYPMP